MKRREFLRMLITGALIALFGNKANAFTKPEKPLKKAMFWRRVD